MDRWNVLDTLYTEKKMNLMYDKAKEFRQDNPVSLKLLLYLIKVTSTLQKKGELQSYIEKYKNLVAAILSSGDGKSQQTPFYVICINDEYQLLQNVFDVKKINSQSLIKGCDLMKFEYSPYYNGTEIYFNISRSLDHMNGTVSRLNAGNRKDIEPGCEIIVPDKEQKNKMSTAEVLGIGTTTASIATMIASMVNLFK